MAETVILTEQTLTFDGTSPVAIEVSGPLVVGQDYSVIWDGIAYTSTAAELDGAVFIGNALLSGSDGANDTGEPFAVAYFDDGCMILTLDAGDHAVSIYLVEETPVGIVLKDWYGKEQTFYNDTIYVQGTDGELVEFRSGVSDPVIEALEVTENGTYTAPDGVDGYSPVTVNVPTPDPVLQDKTITENGTYTADSGYDGLGSVTVEVGGSGGAAGIERVTILSERTFAASFSSSDGCYKATLSFSESIKKGVGYAVCFDGVWYPCVELTFGATLGAISGSGLACMGNYAVRKKYYNNTITWVYDKTCEDYPFCIDSYNAVFLNNADNHTIRVDKIVITE